MSGTRSPVARIRPQAASGALWSFLPGALRLAERLAARYADCRASTANGCELHPTTAAFGRAVQRPHSEGSNLISGSLRGDKTYRGLQTVYPVSIVLHLPARYRNTPLFSVRFFQLTATDRRWQGMRYTPVWGLLVVMHHNMLGRISQTGLQYIHEN